MLEAVQKYFDEKTAADAEYKTAIEAADATYNAERRSNNLARDVRNLRHVEADATRTLRHTQAWNALLDVTDEPLLVWLASRFNSYRGYAEIVMRELPAEASALRKLRIDQGWCGEFSNYLAEAIAQGLVKDDRTPQRAALEDWVSRNIGTSYVETVNEMVAAIQASESTMPEPVADADAEVSQVEHEAQLARVDAVWASVAASAPPTIAVADAEFVFRQAMRAVITGQGEMFADEVAETLTPDHEEQLGRVDTVWPQVAALAPTTIAHDAAEQLFRQAAQAVITGESEMFEATGAAHPDAEADLEPAF